MQDKLIFATYNSRTLGYNFFSDYNLLEFDVMQSRNEEKFLMYAR